MRPLSCFVAALCVAATASGARPAASPSVAQMVGQLLLVRMPGHAPTPSFLARVRSGEVGGVVLYGDNYGPAGPTLLIRKLQHAAAKGGQPRLLIAIDQEGGGVKRLPAARRRVAPSEMTTRGDRAGARTRDRRGTCAATASTSTSRRCSTSATRGFIAEPNVRRHARRSCDACRRLRARPRARRRRRDGEALPRPRLCDDEHGQGARDHPRERAAAERATSCPTSARSQRGCRWSWSRPRSIRGSRSTCRPPARRPR